MKEVVAENSMQGKVCLLTGATSGIGKEAAKALARAGATVVIAARDAALGESVRQLLTDETRNPNVRIIPCELSSFLSIINCCNAVLREFDALHVLINNAGVWQPKRRRSRDGIELTFAVNHLAPFLMTNLLLDRLKASATPTARARVITTTSAMHGRAVMNFEDLEAKKNYNGVQAYAQSKLANVLFTKRLARLLEGCNVTANCAHPGLVSTNLFNGLPKIAQWITRPFMLSQQKGAETTVYLASSPEVETATGEYFDKKKPRHTSKASYNEEAAERLWQISAQYVGL